MLFSFLSLIKQKETKTENTTCQNQHTISILTKWRKTFFFPSLWIIFFFYNTHFTLRVFSLCSFTSCIYLHYYLCYDGLMIFVVKTFCVHQTITHILNVKIGKQSFHFENFSIHTMVYVVQTPCHHFYFSTMPFSLPFHV